MTLMPKKREGGREEGGREASDPAAHLLDHLDDLVDQHLLDHLDRLVAVHDHLPLDLDLAQHLQVSK